MYVRALLPDNGIFLFFSQSVCREFVWEQRIRPGSLCRASAVCFICLCSLPCVGDSINPFSYNVNRFILSKTSPANDGQQIVRPRNNVPSSPFPFIATLPAGRCSPPAHPAMWLQNPRCTTGLPHRRGDWCDPSAMRPYAPGHCPQTAPYSAGCCGPWR